jgi:cyclopropane fatty-acyl-phospholipid synthase-like methyltransferase
MTQSEWLKIGSKWKTTESKMYVLFPALDSLMGNISNKRILDAGCGDGVFVRRCKEKGATAVGIDISPDTIKTCKLTDPKGDYRVMNVKAISLKERFDYVLSSFVLLSFKKKSEIITAIKNMAKLLNKNGRLIIVVPHPAFTDEDNSEHLSKSFPKGYSYSKKGIPILWTNKTNKTIHFTDFHWMIEDYAECINKAGLVIENILEPLPLQIMRRKDTKIYEIWQKYPSVFIFSCKVG